LTTELSKRTVQPLVPETAMLRREGVEWPLERVAMRLLWLLLLLCPFWWCIDWRESKALSKPVRKQTNKEIEEEWEQRRAGWVVGWLALLIAMWLINPAPVTWRLPFALLALVRLLEIVTTGLGTILWQEQQVRARNLVTIIVYAVQVTLIFAIVDHSFAMNSFVPESGTGEAAARASDFLYISWSDMVTLGNSYTPQNGGARFLEVLTTSSGIFLLSVLLAFGINALASSEDGKAKRSQNS
jgi:hypothetical protein